MTLKLKPQACFDKGPFYLGWDLVVKPDNIPGSVGDEVAGIALGKLYLGWYTNSPKLSLMWGDRALIGPK